MNADTLISGPNDAGRRIDRILRVHFPAAGLGRLFAALRKGDIRVNGLKARPDYRVREGDVITVKGATALSAGGADEKNNSAAPERPAENAASAGCRKAARLIEDLVIMENDDYLVLNKPWGRLTHGENGLDELVRAYLRPRLPPSLAFSSGPLHRLDRNTTGVLFFSKSIRGAREFSSALREGRTRKTYLALLGGDLREAESWRNTLRRDGESRVTRSVSGTDEGQAEAGQAARSEARPLLRAGGFTLCEIVIETGRTHQIRAQAAARGLPLAGDRKYGGKPFPDGGGAYILHAREFSLTFGGDTGGGETGRALTVSAPPPAEAVSALRKIFGRRIDEVLAPRRGGGGRQPR